MVDATERNPSLPSNKAGAQPLPFPPKHCTLVLGIVLSNIPQPMPECTTSRLEEKSSQPNSGSAVPKHAFWGVWGTSSPGNHHWQQITSPRIRGQAHPTCYHHHSKNPPGAWGLTHATCHSHCQHQYGPRGPQRLVPSLLIPSPMLHLLPRDLNPPTYLTHCCHYQNLSKSPGGPSLPAPSDTGANVPTLEPKNSHVQPTTVTTEAQGQTYLASPS